MRSRIATAVACSFLTMMAAGAADATLAINSAFFPALANNPGLGGTRWQSEVSVTNFHDLPLTIQFQVSLNGGLLVKPHTLAPLETMVWDNYLAEEWGIEGSGTLVLWALPGDNGGRDEQCLSFSASVRTKNVAANGTYGQEIAPATDDELLGTDVAYFSGIRHFGTPGVSGFRTNIGLWSIDDRALVDLQVSLYNRWGTRVWQQTIQARRFYLLVITLPSSIDVDGGTLTINPLGRYASVVPFVSVVDNATGDGLQRYGLIELASQISQCGVGMLEVRSKEPRDLLAAWRRALLSKRTVSTSK